MNNESSAQSVNAKLRLTIVVNGQPTEVECGREDKFIKIADKALSQTQNTGRPADDWNMLRREGKEFEPFACPDDYDLKDDDVIFLSLKAGIGASAQSGGEEIPKKCDYCEDNIVTADDERLRKAMGVNYSLCKECLGKYDNKTGHCSLDCCISGRCDESC